MDAESRRLRLKTRAFAIIVVLSGALGNFFLSLGMRRFEGELSLSPAGYIAAIFTPFVALGVGLLILWLLTRMALLGFADLSYVLPVTSLGYVASAAMGRIFLHEQISLKRWAGTLLIVGGTILVGLTHEKTVGARR
jgi:drug/metabolite transporter (DMT)-like permease